MLEHNKPVTVGLVGVYGYGRHHLSTLAAPIKAGSVQLVAVADPQPAPDLSSHGSPSVHTSLTELLAEVVPDVVILATPIHTHAPLATEAMLAGAHVLVEKPPTATLAQYYELLATSEATGRVCQVGFQSLGSSAYQIINELLDDGAIGQKTGIGGVGTWVRYTDYYTRSPWAGKRQLGGRDVVDGVLTNPLAHATATALRINGTLRAEDVVGVEVDLYRANAIESDDTSAVRIATANQTQLGLGLILTAEQSAEPYVVVYGTEGKITFYYKTDEVVLENSRGRKVFHATTQNLLLNLIEHVESGAPLLSSLADAGAYMRMHEAVRTARDPMPIDPQFIDWVEGEAGRHAVVQDASDWALAAGTRLLSYATMGVPWARKATELSQLAVAGTVVGSHVDGDAMSPLDSPRPHLHPLRTLGGVTVTDSAPADHTWHSGVGMAVQDVNGFNLWGGRTYVRDQGYTWLPDHGRMEHVEFVEQSESGFVENLRWLGQGLPGDEAPVLAHEQRTVAAAPGAGGGWELRFTSEITNTGASELSLGSPGSNGREAGGYGGFFWRLPACDDVVVATDAAEGEAAVHGSHAPYLGWSGRTDQGAFTLIAYPEQAGEPWFVRAAGYPGFGLSLAWDEPVVLAPGEVLRRSVRVVVLDGANSVEEIRALA